jgi:GDP-D-mannose dehydratase
MWMSLQHPTAEDFVFATGTSTTVREFAAAAFLEAGIELAFQGEGELETASDISTVSGVHSTVLRSLLRRIRRGHRLQNDVTYEVRLLFETFCCCGL